MQDSLKLILQAFINDVWNTGDFSLLDQYLSPAYTVKHDPGDLWEKQTLDHKTYIERVMYSRNAFPDLKFDIQQMISEDQYVVAFWIMSGTHEGDLHNLQATHKPFAITGMTIYEFDADNKICSHTQAYDRLGFIGQMGILG